MSDKISELPDVGRMLQDDSMVVVRSGVTSKCFPDGAGHAANILQSSTNIVIVTPGTFVDIAGTWLIQAGAQYFSNNVSNSATLDYSDERDRFTIFTMNGTVDATANNVVLTTTITVNGTPDPDYEIDRIKKTSGDVESISIGGDVRLSENDTLGMAMTADKATTITLSKAHLIVHNIYYGGIIPFPP